jgi:hypothetical protein
MPLPPIPICPQEPWEAQEKAHRDRSRVKFSFCGRPTVETRRAVLPTSEFRLRCAVCAGNALVRVTTHVSCLLKTCTSFRVRCCNPRHEPRRESLSVSFHTGLDSRGPWTLPPSSSWRPDGRPDGHGACGDGMRDALPDKPKRTSIGRCLRPVYEL